MAYYTTPDYMSKVHRHISKEAYSLTLSVLTRNKQPRNKAEEDWLRIYFQFHSNKVYELQRHLNAARITETQFHKQIRYEWEIYLHKLVEAKLLCLLPECVETHEVILKCGGQL